LSMLSLLAMILALTIPLPLSLLPLGDFDIGMIVCEYVGAFLLGACAIAIGLFLSSLSKNQAGSFLGSVVVLLAIILLNKITGSYDLPYWVSSMISYISLSFHFESFSKGLIDTRDLLFFILVTTLFLFLNTQVILYRKWR